MFALKTLANLCTTQSTLQHSIRTAKVFKPNLLLSKHRNIKVQDGQWVEKDTVLTLQNNLVLYPGENTSIAHDYTIRANVPGFVVLTTESVKPYPHSPLYRYVNSGNDVKRNFIHIFSYERNDCLPRQIERRKIPLKKISPYQIKLRNQTVCFRDLVLRYLHTQLHQTENLSNFVCYDCSLVLLDIEQCAKYLRKTINQLKVKFNKTNRLRTASLSATFQKKRQEQDPTVKDEQLPINQSDSEDEFDDIDDEEEFDEEQDDSHKPNLSTNAPVSQSSKSLLYVPSSSSLKDDSSSKVHTTTNRSCNADEDEDDNGDDDDEGELRKASIEKSQQQNFNELLHRLQTNSMNALSGSNGLITTAATSTNSTQQNPIMNTLANMQRNWFLQFLNDPMAAAQAAQAAAAAVSATQIKANLTPMSLITSNMKQLGSGRKRKSTPEKRVVTNHQSTNNNGDMSPKPEHDSTNNNTSNNNGIHDFAEHPLKLTLKTLQQSNQMLSTPDVHNLATNPKLENGSSSYSQNYINAYQSIDEERREGAALNDSSLSLSPSLLRRNTPSSKRRKVSTPTGQYDYSSDSKNHLSQTSASDLLSPNHQTISNDELNGSSQQKQQRKLDPRTCAECGKTLFSDKTHLLHCQTHAKNEKQCWICGITDDDIKKHIISEHGNQKFTDTGFKCQHCEKVFPVYADLEMHMREHTKKKPFECPICNKRFGQQGNLSCHLRIHSGVKPFTCTHCGKAFRHSNSLRRHARTVHSVSRGLTMSPGSGATTTTATPSSLLLTTATSSNSMVSMANDIHRLSTSEAYDDANSGLMIPSDDAESLQGPPSTSSAGAPSPLMSNAQIDEDSHE
ncbi:unnamed protein product [Adineta ricciae]|uniref:C2H2-type domain-containing protein n=1 Tax=Adineta ricciae TaxID=249248 RepID=A0A814FIG7_ADIRI|nr:unnamed protein product [Adineta ricciae]